MKTKPGFMLRSVGGRNVVVAIGQASLEFNGMITLNETGAFIWKMLQTGCSYDELIDAIKKEYDATEEDIKTGVDALLAQMREANLLEE